MNVSLPLTLVLISSILTFNGQQAQPTSTPTQNRSQPNKRAPSIDDIQSLQNRILAFEDSEAKIRTTILLADIVWSKKNYEPDGRALFQRADELIRSAHILKIEGSSANGQQKPDRSSVTAAAQQSLKQLFVERVSKHDIAWAQSLRIEYGLGPEKKAIDRSQVVTQLRDGLPATAAASLHQMIEENLSGRQALMGFMQLLFELKAQDPQAANKLFVEASLKMTAQSNTSANDILILGNYIFAPRVMDPALFKVARILTSPIIIGEVTLQADVAQARPDISPNIAHIYLTSATQCLEQITFDVEEMQRRAASAYLLLPHARTLAPELATRLTNIVQRGGVSLTEPVKPYSPPKDERGAIDLKKIRASVDAISNSDQRDQFILRVVRQLYFANEFDAASSLSDMVNNNKIQSQLNSVISFGRGAKALESDQTDRIGIAQKSVNSVTDDVQRFLLRMGLAQAYLKQQDKVAAAATINGAIDEFGNRGNDDREPYLILSAVELLASVDPAAATFRLRDAIKSFNALNPSRKGLTTNFTETVKLGSVSATFPLRISGFKNGSFSSAVRSLSAEPRTLREILFDLRDERVLSEAMLAYAGAVLG